MSTTTRTANLLSFFRDDFRMETWLLAGASLQVVSVLIFGRLALMLTGILLVYQLTTGLFKDQGIITTNYARDVNWGKWSTQLPDASGQARGPGGEQIVVFLLGARSNHPRGRFTPGWAKIGEYFGDMWRDCAKNRQTNGFLGKTSTLIATDEDCGNTMCWLSYWKDLDSLQVFANGPVHAKGMVWLNKIGLKQYPSIGIMHETYNIPKGHWETISLNTRPFGMAATQHFVQDKESGETKRISPVVEADGKAWDRMVNRMGVA
ncbi:uncharacterized protein TRUGW13939_08271 [Talaromyces rugulosus]|uniref:Uncharacterized protein n=1 Tax=Talaromyces rugulosus TaxID=121627 RepID=A0A7H8R443_TALRU|nr:uncharacterized protein TRUGW13939_08271 [Talaromyces rugulosus]QKX61124.1 hypothetical protein TRUGW13939_08271 [Talaromyces rugulosus]